MSKEESATLETFSIRQKQGDEIEVERYPTGEIKIRITKYTSRGEYLKHASLILSGHELENFRHIIRPEA
jgi:hypothetical protein